jgi:two-component system, OmpR family, alkaline phosphatase synthesis response regulator PhoP
MTGELILLVDDEPNIVSLARMYLEKDGYQITAVGDGNAALDAVSRHKPALMVLDIMLPGMDGLEVCRRLRANDDPVHILMLTARDDDIDKILGLEMGADDYLTKPFNPRELVARVKAILRRNQRGAATTSKRIYLGDVVIDPGAREFSVQGHRIPLRNQEFDLILTLAEHQGLVLSRESLLQKAWGFDYGGQTRTVDVHIGHLRKKMEGSTVRIETITGVGYKLVP